MSDLQGSCFCGAVAFAAQADIGQGTMRCNCRFCRKMRYWEMRLPDPDSFRLIRGAEALAETPRMQDDGVDMHHHFCGRCGTRLFTRGDLPELGGRFVAVCVNALDNVTDAELAAAPVHYADGAHDAWQDSAPEPRAL